MLFTWKKIPTGYEYNTTDEEVFGSITFRYHEKLEPDMCDDIVSAIMKHPGKAETIEGTIDLPDGELSYTFKKKPLWDKDDTTSIEIKRADIRFKAMSLLKGLATMPSSVISFCRRFVVAFREAFRRAK